MFDKVMKKINLGLIIFIILYIPVLTSLDVICSPFFEFPQIIYFHTLLYLLIPIQVIIYLYNVFKKNIKIGKYDILIYILIILGIITTINAVDVETSIWGAYLRNEGLVVIASYYLLFLNSKSLEKKSMEKIIKCLFFSGILQCIYSFLQVFVRGEYFKPFVTPHMASGFIGNPNMLGSYCVLILGLSISMYFIYKKRAYFWLSIIYFVNLVLAQSTGPFYAFLAMFIFLVILLWIKKILEVKKILILASSLIITFLIISFGSEFYCREVFNDYIQPSSTIRGDIMTTISIFLPESNNGGNGEGGLPNIPDKDEIIANYGSGRFDIWKNTIKIVPNYLWTGAGIDNFGYVYPSKLYGQYVDKAHNEYLQILVTQGIFTLITYLLLLASLFIDGIRSKDSFAWVLLISFVGYAMQAFMNISITAVAPLYFIVCGMLAGVINKEKV